MQCLDPIPWPPLGSPRALLLAASLLVGCAAPPRGRAPDLDPPPARAERLTRAQVLALGQRGEPEEAIEELDRYPFGFDLRAALPELERAALPPAVLDYLRKRSRVDWEALRGEVDPEGRGQGDRGSD